MKASQGDNLEFVMRRRFDWREGGSSMLSQRVAEISDGTITYYAALGRGKLQAAVNDFVWTYQFNMEEPRAQMEARLRRELHVAERWMGSDGQPYIDRDISPDAK